ncbi:MAG: hypothetical protein R2856_21265 [Caldilineaceae bacterium]
MKALMRVREVLGGAVGKGDHEHLAVFRCAFGREFFHQARCQQAQRKGLAAAGHSADPHPPAIVFKDFLLRWAKENRICRHRSVSS